MTDRRTPADVLREARKRDSLQKRQRVLNVIDDMKDGGEPITFLSVAKKAGVSNWLVYAEGVREHIEAARQSQHLRAARHSEQGAKVSGASLAVDLELARAELKNVRAERDRLKAKVQRGLGQLISQVSNSELEQRLQELGDQLQQRETSLAEVQGERDALRQKLAEAEDTVGSLRRALKQMMRDQGA
jgi:chromosome segregation ATPase